MLKISGESLAGDNEQGFDFDVLNDLSQNIKILAEKDISISIVLGGIFDLFEYNVFFIS